MSVAENTSRRDRLVAFIEPWALGAYADHFVHRYRPRIGSPGLGEIIPVTWLTTEALETLAGRIVSDFWGDKRLRRVNRSFTGDMRAALEAAAKVRGQS